MTRMNLSGCKLVTLHFLDGTTKIAKLQKLGDDGNFLVIVEGVLTSRPTHLTTEIGTPCEQKTVYAA
jgi:hypothetical protein